MSFSPAPKYTGAAPIAAFDPVAQENVDTRFDPTVRTYKAILVGDAGSAATPTITLYMLDGSILVYNNVSSGQLIEVENRGVQNITDGMWDLWGLY